MTDQSLIGFAGLSHLGIVYSLATAARGFSVVAFDSHESLPKDLTAGRFPIREPGLEELFRSHSERIRYTSDPDALKQCGLIFVALDVQTDDSANSDLAPLKALIKTLTAQAVPGRAVTLLSQVPPGFCRRLASEVGSRCQLYYQAETLVFGNAVERAVHPERYIVGSNNPARPLPELYRHCLQAFGCPILTMRYESAELCKLAINCLLASSVCISNSLAELCESIGADWSEITPALRLDRRIGEFAYLTPGLGIAGGNLERDLVSVEKLAAEFGSDSRVIGALQQNSSYIRDWALRRLFRLGLLSNPAGTLFAMWGLSYKPDTHSTKNSCSLALLRSLAGYQWSVHDPAVQISSAEFSHMRTCESALEAVQDATALVVMTPWDSFSRVPLKDVENAMRGHHILDPYAILDQQRCLQLGFTYNRLGARAC